MVLTDEKRHKIEKLLIDGYSQNKITKLLSCSKATVQKVKKEMDDPSTVLSPKKVPHSTELEVTIEDVDRYIKKCLVTGKDPNTALLNTAIKLLEFKNKVDPEDVKRETEKERVEFQDTIGDALDYIHSIRPDYQAEISPESGRDDKASGVEGQ